MLANNHISQDHYNEFPSEIHTQKEFLVQSIFGVPQYGYTKMDTVFNVVYENRKKISLHSNEIQLTEDMCTLIKSDIKRKIQLNLAKKVRVVQSVYYRDSIEFTLFTYTVTKNTGEVFSFISVPNYQTFFIPETFLRQLMTKWGTAIYH